MPFSAEHSPASLPGSAFDIDESLDNARFSRLTFWIIFVIALAVVLEAVSNNLLGLAIPKLVDDWHKPHEAFKYAVTFSMIGMAAGAFISGFIADKIGRRSVILGTLPICGIATALTGGCASMEALIILRFLVGFGFGGLLPVASSMTAEFAAKNWRTIAVTVPIICVALGTAAAGLLFSLALSFLGSWHYAFYLGGILPLILCAVLCFTLPESPRFMAQHKRKWQALRHLLRRLGHSVPEDAVFADEADGAQSQARGGGVKALFQNGLAHDTVAVWVIAFFGIAGLYAIYMWLPTMMGAEGVSEAASGRAMAYWFSFGGIIGALICAWAVAHFGSRRMMIGFAAGAAVTIFALLTFDVKQHLLLMSVFLGLHGLFNNGVQAPLYAIFAHLYPTPIRATGSSMASAMGKMGAIFAGFLGGVLGVRGYLILLTVFMVLVLLALTVFKRHIPPIDKNEA